MLAVVAGMAAPGFAAEDSESSDVNVTVNQELKLNVAPDTLAYTVDPGSYNNTSKNDYTGIEIENTGSRNISDVYAKTSYPADRPFGTGAAGEYDTGNFIQLRTTNELNALRPDDGYQYIQRREFNESNDLAYFKAPSGNSRYGRFRTGNESFFWAITNSQDGGAVNGCDGGGSSELLVGDVSQTQARTGSVDFTDASNYHSHTVSTAGDNYGRVNLTWADTYDGNKSYDAYTWCGQADSPDDDNSTHVFFTKWNAEQYDGSGNYDLTRTTEGQQLILDAADNQDELQPGEHFTMETRVSVPNAVAQGEVGQGTLTIVVSDADVSSNDAGV